MRVDKFTLPSLATASTSNSSIDPLLHDTDNRHFEVMISLNLLTVNFKSCGKMA
jgi:hypothetical protein